MTSESSPKSDADPTRDRISTRSHGFFDRCDEQFETEMVDRADTSVPSGSRDYRTMLLSVWCTEYDDGDSARSPFRSSWPITG